MIGALKQAVQGLLEEREQQKYQIYALEGIWPVLFFIHTASCMHTILLHIYVLHLCLDSQVESLGSCVKPLERLTPNLSHYSITKVAAGGPRAEGSSRATLGGAEKGTAGPSRPGAGTGPSPNTNRTTKVQCCQWPSPRAAE